MTRSTPWVARLLEGVDTARPTPLAAHHARHGPLHLSKGRGDDPALVREIERSGLLGRGGAGFPAGRKARTVAAGRRPVVVANGNEGEPASHKDELLMMRAPHLVLDGLEVAARAVGARETHLVLHRGSPARPVLDAALDERRGSDVTVHEAPTKYVSSEASATVHWLNGGEAKPTFAPPQVYERGVHGRPTLVHNVETLAHMALIARHGADWFRSVGDGDEPGTMLLTLTTPAGVSVREVPTGTPVGVALQGVGVAPDEVGAVLIGGYFGSWMTRDQAWHLPLTHYAMKGAGGGLGAGVVIALPATGVCGLAETAHLADYLARDNAGQCGPCLNGLPALAAALAELAFAGRANPAIGRWLSVIPRRGACAHPDGATRMIASALATFSAEVDRHTAHGPCAAARNAPTLPVPADTADWR